MVTFHQFVFVVIPTGRNLFLQVLAALIEFGFSRSYDWPLVCRVPITETAPGDGAGLGGGRCERVLGLEWVTWPSQEW